MKTILNLLSDGPTNKQDIDDLTSLSLAEIEEEDEGYLDTYVKVKALSAALETFLEAISKKALEEAQRWHSDKEKTFGVLGAMVSVAENGTKYHFDKCNDFQLPVFMQQLESAKSSVDARQKFLKNLDGPMDVVDPDTGEMVKIFPASKTSTTGLKISFVKLNQ